MLLLKIRRHKTSLVALERTIRSGLNPVNPLARNRTNMCRKGNKIPCASALKSSNLLCHRILTFLMMNSCAVRDRLGKNSAGNKPVWKSNRPTIVRKLRRRILCRR
uniref:Uncharacterized protein n=1 Tax=Arundo donax TaxID=35708 RepID=A0A0A9AHB6_ARUDO